LGGGKGETLRSALSSPSAERQARKPQNVRFREAASARSFDGLSGHAAGAFLADRSATSGSIAGGFEAAGDPFALPGLPLLSQQRLTVSMSAAHSGAALATNFDAYALLPGLLEQQRDFAAEAAARRGGAGLPSVAGGATARA
jgi:hypothetical protein